MFYQDSKFKLVWDISMTMVLFVICTVLPYHMAFRDETTTWCKIFYFFDSLFLLDILLTFFTTLPEDDSTD